MPGSSMRRVFALGIALWGFCPLVLAQPPAPDPLSKLKYGFVRESLDLEFDPPAPGTYELPVIDTVGNHALLDSNGRQVQILDLKKDKLAVLAFIYTSCAEAWGCPLAMGVLERLDRTLTQKPELASKVVLFSISFDPERDTPKRMAEVKKALKPKSKWYFLTAADAFRLKPLLEDFNQPAVKLLYPDGSWSGLFRHVLKVFLLDEEDRVRNIYSAGLLHPQLVLNDVKTLLLEKTALLP